MRSAIAVVRLPLALAFALTLFAHLLANDSEADESVLNGRVPPNSRAGLDPWGNRMAPTIELNPDATVLPGNLSALRARRDIGDVVGCFASGSPEGLGYCLNNGDWLHRAVDAGAEAGIDPRLILGRVLIEMRNKISKSGYGRKPFIRDSNSKLALYEYGSGVYRFAAWLFGKNGEDGPSLGVGDMKRPVFDLVRSEYPAEFQAHQFRDLINDDRLAIRMLAHYYRHIRDAVLPTMSARARANNTDWDLMDLYYWKGPQQSKPVTTPHGIDYHPRSKKHLQATAQYRELADELICHSGVYVCS